MENEKIKLLDLIGVEELQRIQNAFSAFTGMGALIRDADNAPITEPTNSADFCYLKTRNTEIGKCMCDECDRFGAEEALKTGKSLSYRCHTGLIDFSAPIITDGQLIGCFFGGQILSDPPVKSEIYSLAEYYGIDPEEYWEAAQKINVLSKETIDIAADFIQTISEVLSSLAYSKYITDKANSELEKMLKFKVIFSQI